VPSGSQPAAPAPPNATISLYNFFSPGGLLSRTHPAYEFRRGQLQMAQAVELAIEERRHLIVEAGTGTGKTLAYLMPAIRSSKRVIISTGTKNLQEQLFYKDVPFLEQALFPDGNRKLSVCYMKGRGNYLCRKKLYDLTDQPVLSGIAQSPPGSRPRKPAIAPNWLPCRKRVPCGTSSTPAPIPAPARSAARGTNASLPKCVAVPPRATL
jgi:hypothetical protein